ncbi:MAG: DUF4130 domain-containing protein [Candidatus Omnitrophica bacterium]|nr:DUF4130 domain-containing protein [Candidatus Omnitrophota bacterium]
MMTIDYELHRWQGFTRFRPQADGRMLAFIDPQYDILNDLALYFFLRMPGRDLIIVDTLRSCAAVTTAEGIRIIPWATKSGDIPHPSDDIEDLWRAYVDTIAIKERHNPKLQHQHIPRRYRKNLIEKII